MTTSIITTREFPQGFGCIKMDRLEEPYLILINKVLPPKSPAPSDLFFKKIGNAESFAIAAARRFSNNGNPVIYIPSESKIHTIKPLGNLFAPYTLNISNGRITSIICSMAEKTFQEAAEISKNQSFSTDPPSVFIPYYFTRNASLKR